MVSAANTDGTQSAASAQTATVLATLTNVTAPSIKGAGQTGATLSAVPGAWNVTPTAVTYTWERCAANGTSCVPVASGASYTVSGADAGGALVLAVTAAAAGQSATSDSAALAVQSPVTPPSSGGSSTPPSPGGSSTPPSTGGGVTAPAGGSTPSTPALPKTTKTKPAAKAKPKAKHKAKVKHQVRRVS